MPIEFLLKSVSSATRKIPVSGYLGVDVCEHPESEVANIAKGVREDVSVHISWMTAVHGDT